MRKTKFLIIGAMLFAVNFVAYAQEVSNLLTKKATSLERKYLRPSLTKLYITDGSSLSLDAAERLKKIEDYKFDANGVKNDIYSWSEVKNKSRDEIKAYIDSLLSEEKISNQIIHDWFPVDSEGNLSFEKIVNRGMFGATDADVKQANASKRGDASLNELGEQLIDRSYIIAYIITDNSSTNKKGELIESVEVNPYVYKLDFNDETRSTLYLEENYTPEGIDKMTFPTKYVTSGKNGASILKFTNSEGKVKFVNEEDYNDIMFKVRKVSDFQVKSPITYTHPIRANIGKKEGVKCDQRFAVMRMTSKDGENFYAQRVGTVRATGKIMDNLRNADGTVNEDDQTKFYEIKGRKLIPGETLVEDKDMGFMVSAEYTISEASFSVGYRFGQFIKVPGLFAYLKIGMPWSKGMGGIKILGIDKNGEAKSFQVLTGSIGVAKDFNFAGSFSLTGAAEFGYLFAPGAKHVDWETNTYDKDKNYDTKSYKVGAHVKLGYYILRNLQFYVNAGYNYFIKSDEFEALQSAWVESEKSNRKKFQNFQPLSFGAGIRFEF